MTPVAPVSPTPGATIFCDFDGPIADVSDRYYATYCQALGETQAYYQAQGIVVPVRLLTKTQFWEMKQRRVPDPTIADWSGLEPSQGETFLARVNEIVNETTLLHLDKPQPGAREALQRLRDRGLRIVIVTLRHSAQVMEFLYDHDFTTLVSQIYGANDDSLAYPNRVAHKVAQLAGAIADQRRLGYSIIPGAWMIGDTEADVEAGHAAQLPTIALTCGIRSAAYLATCRPTRLHGSLKAAADYLLCARPQSTLS